MATTHRSGDGVRARLRDVARDVFAFDLEAYLATFGRELWGVICGSSSKDYRRLFGAPDIDAIASLPFHEVQSGYRTDVGHLLPGVAADVFLVKADRLMDNEFNFDALLVHELAHLLTDPDLKELSMIAPEQAGSELVRRLISFVPDDWHHTGRFFQIFVAGCRRLGELTAQPTLDVISAGLRHEQWFDGDYLAQQCAD
jgi:hypothetical protein